MRVSTQFPIAFHVLLMIAYFPNVRVTSEMMASSTGCNAVIIRNIFSKLKNASLLSVHAGKGGTALAKPAQDITLWDIYTAIETDRTDEIFKIHTNTSGTCPVGSNIHDLLLNHLDNAVDAMKEEMSGVNLQMIIEELNSQLDEPIDRPKENCIQKRSADFAYSATSCSQHRLQHETTSNI